MKILVCEDEEIMLTTLEFRLRRKGFKVVRAEDGRKAVALVQSEKPDLVVTDIMMPHVTGLELIDFMRTKLKSKIPIIVISALEDDDIILEAAALGATDFISKPFKPSELVLRIRLLFEDKKKKNF